MAVALRVCKLCRSPFAGEVNKKLAKGEQLKDIVAWLKAKEFVVGRDTLAIHRDHIDPRAAFVKKVGRQAPRVTANELLQSFVDKTAQNIELDPDSVTNEQGIKAATALAAQRDKQVNVLMVLAKYLTGNVPKEIEQIEGSYVELPMQETNGSEHNPSPEEAE